MKKISSTLLIVSSLLLASSCAQLMGPQKLPPLDYIDKGAKLDIKKFFNGDVEGFAIIQDANGKIIDTQSIKINGKWEENKGIVQQLFVYADGTKDSRTWLFTVEQDGSFEAVGHNVSGPAQGRQIGNAYQMLYTLSVMQNGVKQPVKIEDNGFLADEKSMLVISKFKKGYSASGKAIISLKKLNSKTEAKIDIAKVEILKSDKADKSDKKDE